MGQSWAGPTKLVKLGHFEHDITKIWGSVDSFDPHRTHIDTHSSSGFLVRTFTRFAGTA